MTGRAEIWGSLKLCCESLWEGDVATAQGILDAAGVTVPTGDLVQGAYDEMGGLYVLPGWVVGEPDGVVDEEEGEEGKELALGEGGKDVGSFEKKGKEVAVDAGGGVEGMVRVRARLSDRGGPDVVVLIGREDSIAVLARRIAEQAKVRPPSQYAALNTITPSPQAPTDTGPSPPTSSRPNPASKSPTSARFSKKDRRSRRRVGKKGTLSTRWSSNEMIYICHIYISPFSLSFRCSTVSLYGV